MRYTYFVTLLFIFIFGLAVGSFLNVLIDRLPQEKSIFGRSRCDYCKRKLKAKDLIPVLSFILLKGRCRYCHKKLSLQYPLVELLTGATFVLISLVIPDLIGNPSTLFRTSPIYVGSFTPFRMTVGVQDDILLLAYLGLFSCLIVIFFADWKYRIIPDQIHIILFVFSAVIIYLQTVPTSFSWLIHLRDGVLAMLPILIIYLVTKGKSIGFADVKLAFIIGFFLQIVPALYAIYFAFVGGAIFGVILIILTKKKMKDVIAFGPFLALGFAVMIFFGQSIISFFQRFYF